MVLFWNDDDIFVTSQTTGKGNLNILQATKFYLLQEFAPFFPRNKLLCFFGPYYVQIAMH